MRHSTTRIKGHQALLAPRLVAAIGFAMALGPAALVAGCKSTPEQRREAAVERRAEAVEDLRTYLRDDVKDPGRSREGLALLDEIEALISQVDMHRTAFEADIAKLHRDHATDDVALLERVDAFRNAREPLRAQALATRKKMRGVLTAEEWTGYAKRELSLVIASRSQGGFR
jgi:hypothetical protein